MAKIVDHSERQPGVSLIEFVSFAIVIAKQLKKINQMKKEKELWQ